MITSHKPTGTASSIPGGLGIGVMASLMATALVAAILALMVSKECISQEHLGYGVMILLFCSSAIGSTVAYRRIQRRRLLVFTLSALCYLVTLTSITALFFGGQFDGIFPTAMLIISGSGIAFLRSVSSGRRGKHSKIAKHFR